MPDSSGPDYTGKFFAQGIERIGLAPFHFLVSRPFELGLGDDEGIRAAAGERIEHPEGFIEIGHSPSPFTMGLCFSEGRPIMKRVSRR